MIKVKDGYAKLINTSYTGDISLVLLSNGNTIGYDVSTNTILATIGSNVASADKLKTKVKLWGLDFDGTADVSGAIIMDNSTFISMKDTGGADRVILNFDGLHRLFVGNGTSSAGYNTYIDGKNIYLRYGTSHTTGLLLNNSGNITIGSSDLALTSYKLYVDGMSWFNSQMNVVGNFYKYNAAGTYRLSLVNDSDYCSIYNIKADGSAYGNLVFQGNVGIGTTSPSTKLHVSGTALASKFMMSGTTGAITGIARSWTDTYNDAASNARPWCGLSVVPGQKTYEEMTLANYYGMLFKTGGSGFPYIFMGGDVGIGTTSPSAKLHVNGTVRATNYIYSDSLLWFKQGSEGIYIGHNAICWHNSGTGWVSNLIGFESNKVTINQSTTVQGNILATGGFLKLGSDNTYVLLGGGGHKPVSDFASASSLGNYLPLSGGTMTGKINFSADPSDVIWIGATAETSGSKSFLDFFISDDATDAFRWRTTLYKEGGNVEFTMMQLSGSNTGVATLALTGNMTATGTVTANKFVSGNGVNDFSAGTVKLDVLNIPTSSGGTTFGPGSNGQVLKSNGTTVYWASDSNSNSWRAIQVNGTQIAGTGTNTYALNFVSGTGITVEGISGSSSAANGITITNAGVRSVTIGTGDNADKVAVNTNGTTTYLTIPYATNASKLNNLGHHTEAASSATVPSSKFPGVLHTQGLYMTCTYNDTNTPSTFGNIINVLGTGGSLLLLGWNGTYKTGNLYYRSHRDVTTSGGWTDWEQIAYISNIPTKVSDLTNDSGFVTGGPYLPLAGGTMTGVISMKNDVNPRISFIPSSGGSTLGTIYLMGGSSTAYSGIRYKFRQWSYTANSLTRLSYYEDYNLPETAAGLTANASYTILTTKSTYINNGVITINGTSITPLTSHQSLANYLSLSKINNNTNVNTLTSNNLFYTSTDGDSLTLTNAPFSRSFIMLLFLNYSSGDDVRRSRIAISADGSARLFNDRGTAGNGGDWYDILTNNNSSVSGGGSTWGSSITVTINGVSKTLTIPSNPNTWRGITDSYSGTDSTISLSQKGGNALYNALVNGYASSAGNADTVDNKHASDFAEAGHTHGTYHSNFTTTLANTTTDSGWSMINASYNSGFLLKSIRTQASAPGWIEGNYAAGICFGGADTKGVISCAYGSPAIRIAGGNGTKPVWWIRLVGTSGAGYNLDSMPYAVSAGTATKAALVLVYQHISNDVDYPLIWTNVSNANSVFLDLLYKSYNHLMYNPKYQVLKTGSLLVRSTIKMHTGDAALAIYSGRITDGKSDGNICFLTSIDNTDPQSHSHPTLYLSRCNISLLPRGGLVYIGTNPDGGNTSYKLYVAGNTYASGSLYAAHFYENSDIRLKTNIEAITTSDNIPQLKEFDWKEDGSHSYGLIAQELEEQGYSELVSTKDDGYKTVNYSAALSLIVGKLQVKIKELEKEIEELKNK